MSSGTLLLLIDDILNIMWQFTEVKVVFFIKILGKNPILPILKTKDRQNNMSVLVKHHIYHKA